MAVQPQPRRTAYDVPTMQVQGDGVPKPPAQHTRKKCLPSVDLEWTIISMEPPHNGPEVEWPGAFVKSKRHTSSWRGENEASVGHRGRRRLKPIAAKVSNVMTSIAEQSISVGKDIARLALYLTTAARHGMETCCKFTLIKSQSHPCVRSGNRRYSRRRILTSQSIPFHVDAKPADWMVGFSLLLSRKLWSIVASRLASCRLANTLCFLSLAELLMLPSL